MGSDPDYFSYVLYSHLYWSPNHSFFSLQFILIKDILQSYWIPLHVLGSHSRLLTSNSPSVCLFPPTPLPQRLGFLDISNLPCPFYTLESFLVFSVSGCLRDSLLASKMEMFFLYASSFSLPSLWVQVNPLLCMACLASWTFQGTVLFLGSIMYGHVSFPPKAVNSLKRGGFLFIFITSASSHLAGSQ